MPYTTYSDRASWLAARRDGLGASDMGAVLNMSPYRSQRMVWADKCGLSEPTVTTERMAWGTIMEPIARQWLEETWGTKTEHVPPFTTYTHPVHAWMRSTPDDFVTVTPECEAIANEGRYVVDYKIAHPRDPNYRDGMAPPSYSLQVYWQMLVTGAEHGLLVVVPMSERVDEEKPDEVLKMADLVSDMATGGWSAAHSLRLLGCKTPFVRLYHRTDAFNDVAKVLIHDGSVFWHRVLATRKLLAEMGGEIDWNRLREWEPDATAADIPDLAKRFTHVRDVEYEVPVEDAAQFVLAVTARKAAEETFDAIKAKLAQNAGDARVLSHKGKRLAIYYKKGNGRVFTPAQGL